jgi:hypothetical protein
VQTTLCVTNDSHSTCSGWQTASKAVHNHGSKQANTKQHHTKVVPFTSTRSMVAGALQDLV